MSARLALGLALIVSTLLPGAAQACAVCFSGSDETREAFAYTAAALSFLPLATMGGFLFFFIRRSRQMAAESLAELESAPIRPDSSIPPRS